MANRTLAKRLVGETTVNSPKDRVEGVLLIKLLNKEALPARMGNLYQDFGSWKARNYTLTTWIVIHSLWGAFSIKENSKHCCVAVFTNTCEARCLLSVKYWFMKSAPECDIDIHKCDCEIRQALGVVITSPKGFFYFRTSETHRWTESNVTRGVRFSWKKFNGICIYECTRRTFPLQSTLALRKPRYNGHPVWTEGKFRQSKLIPLLRALANEDTYSRSQQYSL